MVFARMFLIPWPVVLGAMVVIVVPIVLWLVLRGKKP
jgi:hypothetical protein